MPDRSNGRLGAGSGMALWLPSKFDVRRLDEPMRYRATARPLYLVKEIAVVSQTELVVAPVPMTVDPRIEMKLIPKHARVTEFDVSIMVGTEQSYVHGHCPYLLPRADCGLGQRYTQAMRHADTCDRRHRSTSLTSQDYRRLAESLAADAQDTRRSAETPLRHL